MLKCTYNEEKSQYSTPYLGKSANTTVSGYIGKSTSRPETTLRSIDGKKKIHDTEAINSCYKPTYVQFSPPQITVKKHSTSAEIIL